MPRPKKTRFIYAYPTMAAFVPQGIPITGEVLLSVEELEAIIALYAEPAQDAEEERRQHVASLQFHARLSDFGQNAVLGYEAKRGATLWWCQ